MRVIEIGAGAAGFQFVLASCGLQVVSVDPLKNPSETVDWIFSGEDFERLTCAFGTEIRFVRDYLENADLESSRYDRVFAISAIEHIPESKACSIMREVRRVLKPGGLFVATIDLFLDCYPFTEEISNQYGRNISIRRLVEESGLTLISGTPSQLYGYPEFEVKELLRNKEAFLTANNAMSQCIVLQKPIEPSPQD
jgi:SAM-dependent methyltransferase